jgi:DNA-binding response OmpR family regulator
MARVLVIDDEEVVRDSVAKILRREGLEADLVADAPEGLRRLDAGGYDLIITDLMMPGMDGLALLRELAARGLATPAIMITGYATVRTAVEALQLGAFDYVAKPFTRAELGAAVARALKLADAPAPEPGAELAESGGLAAFPVGTMFILRDHSWARLEQDGQLTVGALPVFARSAGPSLVIDLPRPGEVIEQGHSCARLGAADSRVHVVWAPATGRVTEVNGALRADPDLLAREPLGAGWLLKMIPLDLKREAAGLRVITRPARGATGSLAR